MILNQPNQDNMGNKDYIQCFRKVRCKSPTKYNNFLIGVFIFFVIDL